MNIYYVINTNLVYTKENEEMLIKEIKQKSNENFEINFKNTKYAVAHEIYGPELTCEFIHLVSKQEMSFIQLLLTFDFSYSDDRLKTIREILFYLNGYAKDDSETKIRMLISPRVSVVDSARYKIMVNRISIFHKFINNRNEELNDFIDYALKIRNGKSYRFD